jgi:phosphatidylglycerol:prolipoprotein diacylglycerol transferase
MLALRNMQRRVSIYTVMMYFGAVSGILVGTRWAAAHGLDASRVSVAMILLLVPALTGARLLFVATHRDLFRRHQHTIFPRTQAGAALYGGLILAMPFSYVVLPILRLDFRRFWDSAAIAMLVGMIFAKFGCLLNGCCAGRPWRGTNARGGDGRAVRMTDRIVEAVTMRRFPSQIIEAALAGTVLFLSLRAASGSRDAGTLFLSAVAGYGAGRWLLEPARDRVDRVRGVSVNRAVSASTAILAAGWLLLMGG